MTKRRIVILVPALYPTGPIKGAVALANALVRDRQVTLVSLKGGSGAAAPIDGRVGMIDLREDRGWISRLRFCRRLLTRLGPPHQVASVSFCFSADLINALCRNRARILSSVRGNLPVNYRHDYGPVGSLLAGVHMLVLRRFHHLVAMTESMARQISIFTHRRPVVIGNFVDEAPLESRRQGIPVNGSYHFVFCGSLSIRKRPILTLEAIGKLRNEGFDCRLDLLGNGPLRLQIECFIAEHRLEKTVVVHGHVDDPLGIIAQADVFVLPSTSEGLSRAALEALHLGVPCVLRDVDGNRELINNHAGELFTCDEDLVACMRRVAESSRRRDKRESLLPPPFRQSNAAKRYLDLIEGNP